MLKELAEGGFIDPDPGLNPETGEEARVSRYRLRDNYTRFYLKYIEPRKGIDAKGGVCRRDQAPERDRRRDREGGRGADEASAAPARNEQAPRVGLRRTCRYGRRGRRILLRDHPSPQATWDMTCFMAEVVDDGRTAPCGGKRNASDVADKVFAAHFPFKISTLRLMLSCRFGIIELF